MCLKTEAAKKERNLTMRNPACAILPKEGNSRAALLLGEKDFNVMKISKQSY